MPWQTTDADAAACDVAYLLPGEPSPPARLTIVTSRERWRAATKEPPADNDEAVLRLLGMSAVEAPLSGEDGALFSDVDPLPECFALLAGRVERRWPRNQHGQVLPAGVTAAREDVRLGAYVTAAANRLGACLSRAGIAVTSVPRWPHGRRWAACATHDVDYPQAIRWLEPWRVMRRLGRSGAAAAAAVALGRRHHWQFAAWMELERSIGVASAFYFVPLRGSLMAYALGTPDPFYDVADQPFVELFRQLEEAGFEVGLQASYRACESPAQLGAEKARLEQAAGRPVDGNRHHYWRLDPVDPDRTLAAHGAAGLAYDCSLGFERHPGWRRGAALPFVPFAVSRAGATVIQLPTAWMDAQLFTYLGEAAATERRQEVLAGLLHTAATTGGLFVADMHEYVFDDALYPGWSRLWRWCWEQVMGHRDVWTALPRDIARHWRARERDLVAASHGLELTGTAVPEGRV
jgi:hypothetical protein